MIRRTVVVAVSIAAVLASGLVSKAETQQAERVEVLTHAIALDERAVRAEARSVTLSIAVAQALQDQVNREGVLDARETFLSELEDLNAALDAAEGRVNTDDQRAAAIAAQETVLTERDSPDAVLDAGATIDALADDVRSETASWADATAGEQGATGDTAGGYARVRAALDRVGGDGVGLYESASCAGGSAPACANSNGYIKYRSDIAGWSNERLHWAMAHELAHIYQFRVWGALNSAGVYHSLFGSDPEFLANCMAVVRGYPGAVGCSAEQQEWASGIWVGAVG
ncbi:MAG: hypothetical protein ACQEW8_06560 [Actinomycetota bacterium]